MLSTSLVLVVALLTQSSVPTPPRKQSEAVTRKADSAKQESAAPAISVTNNSPSDKQAEAPDQQQSKPPRLWDIYWPTLLLVFVGIVAAGIALRTLNAIKKTAESTERSVNAFMDAERSLIVIAWENNLQSYSQAPNGGLSHCLTWYAQNVGKSPAFLEAISSRFVLIKGPSELPPEPIYSTPQQLRCESEPVLVGEKSGKIYTPLEGAVDYYEVEMRCQTGEYRLYAYGYVKYKDIHDRPHETRFGLLYDSDGFRLVGPPAYNHYR